LEIIVKLAQDHSRALMTVIVEEFEEKKVKLTLEDLENGSSIIFS